MRISRTYYEVMGLPREADPRQVKAKYHELARQFHPDRAADKTVAERLFVQINLAYRTLSDPDKRAVYDASLFQADAATSRRPDSGSPPPAGASAPPPRPTAPPPPARPQINVAEVLGRANAAYMGGDRITTHKLSMEVLRADPNNAEAHALLGDVYADQGRRPDALNEYRTAQRAGDTRVSLQAKIKRMEGLVGSTQAAPSAAQAGSTRPPSAPATSTARPPQPTQADPKKSGFLDRFTRKDS